MGYTVAVRDGYTISDDRTRLNMSLVHALLRTTSWAANRPQALTERSWANCLGFGIYAAGGVQVGFARVLTDYAFRAHLADVFVQPAERGRGLAKALVAAILAHPQLTTVTQWTLTTSDAHGLYAQYGFRLAEPDGKWMTLDRPLAEL